MQLTHIQAQCDKKSYWTIENIIIRGVTSRLCDLGNGNVGRGTWGFDHMEQSKGRVLLQGEVSLPRARLTKLWPHNYHSCIWWEGIQKLSTWQLQGQGRVNLAFTSNTWHLRMQEWCFPGKISSSWHSGTGSKEDTHVLPSEESLKDLA